MNHQKQGKPLFYQYLMLALSIGISPAKYVFIASICCKGTDFSNASVSVGPGYQLMVNGPQEIYRNTNMDEN